MNIILQRIYDVNLANDMLAVADTIDCIVKYCQENGVSNLDLSHLSAEKINIPHLVAVLRLLYINKKQVKGYEDALLIAKQLLDAKNKKSALILKGLFD